MRDWEEVDLIEYALLDRAVYERLIKTQDWQNYVKDFTLVDFDGDEIKAQEYLKINSYYEAIDFILYTPAIKDEIYKEFLDEFEKDWHSQNVDFFEISPKP